MGGSGTSGASAYYGNYWTKYYSGIGIPAHNQVNVTYTVYAVDSWDGTTSDDHYSTSVDGVMITCWHFSAFAGYAYDFCGTSSFSDFPAVRAYLTFPHTATSMTVTFTNYLDQVSTDESLGIRDIQYDFVTMASPALSICGRSNGTPLPEWACPCSTTNQYMNPPNSGTCFPCYTLCATCTAGTATDCTSCYPGYYLSGGQCLQCSSNCATCSGTATTCTSCNSGWFMVGTTCYSSCNSPLYSYVSSGVTYCATPCPGEYVMWDGSCSTTCAYSTAYSTFAISAVTVDTFAECTYPCSSNEYLYFNGSCLSTCPSPLTTLTYYSRGFCDYSCPSSDYLYWNGSCLSTCPSPLSGEVEGTSTTRKFCWYTCQPSEYLYWNGSCLSTCPAPLSGETEGTYLQRKFCWYTCQPTEYLYWNESCLSTCPSPLSPETQGTNLPRQFCWYTCQPNQYLYWNGSCIDTCPSPLSGETQGTYLQRNFCWYICMPWQWLYWDETCQETCDFPLWPEVQGTNLARNFCWFSCSPDQFVYWNGTCSSTCPEPLTNTNHNGEWFCEYPCSSTQYLYWNGSCLDSCPSPLSGELEGTYLQRYFCWYTCQPDEFLYWDGSCQTSCDFPLVPDVEGSPERQFCWYLCPISDFLYWNGTCSSQCDPPLTQRTSNSRYFCDYSCTSDQYLAWNGSCLDSCPYPLSVRVEGDTIKENFCDYPCDPSEYLYWNGSCLSTCDSPLSTRIEGSLTQRKFCDYPCVGNQYLYWNGTCKTTCVLPLVVRIDVDKCYCDYLCPASETMYWDGSCSATCDSPLVSQSQGNPIRNYCRYPCLGNQFLYWNGSCSNTCGFPLTSYVFKSRLFCNYTCNSNQFLYFNGSCLDSCSLPYSTRVENNLQYCDYPCETSEYLYWNGSCLATCNAPLLQSTTDGYLYCSFPCSDVSAILYWNGTCAYDCPQPLTTEAEGPSIIRTFCVSQCPTQYLYWNSTCSDYCDFPLTQSTTSGINFCLYPCETGQYLYWNGSCLGSCDSPLSTRTEGALNYCDYPCQDSEYLYWNGSCIAECLSPLSSQTIDNKLYCSFPCNSLSNYLYWNQTCSSQCEFPLTSKTEGGYNFCQNPCDPSDYLYWNGSCLMTCPSPFIQTTDNTYQYCGSPCGDITLYYYPDLERCDTTCHQPAFIKNSTGYLTCEALETSTYQSSFDNLFLYAPLEEGTWTVVKLVKTMQYVKYLDINMPPRLQRLSISKGRNLLSISSGLTMPESLQNKLTQSSQKTVPFVYLKNNLNANFLINFWDDLMTIVIAFLLACFFTAFEKLSHAFNWAYPANIFSTLRNIAQWNFPLMILAINIDDVILFSAIQFKTSSGASLSLFFSVIFILVIITLMGLIYFIAVSLRKSPSKKFTGFQVLYSAFRPNNIFNQLFFLFYMLRIGLPILVAVLAESYPIIICVPQIIISLVALIYILKMKPFIKKINHYQMLIFESVVLLMNISMLILTILSNKGLQNHQLAIILGDLVILGNDCINIMCVFFLIIQVHHEAILLKEKTSKINKPERIGLWCRLLFYILQQGNMGFEELSYFPHQTVKQKRSNVLYIEEDDRENLRFTTPDTLRKSHRGGNEHDFSLVGCPGSPVPEGSTRDLGPTSFRDQLTINDFAMNQEGEPILTFSGPTSTTSNRLQRGRENSQKWIDYNEKESYEMNKRDHNRRKPFENAPENRLKIAGRQLTLAKRISNKDQGNLTSSQGLLNSPNHSPIYTFKDFPEDHHNDTLLMLQGIPSIPMATGRSNLFEKSLLKNWKKGGLELSLDGISGNNSQIASPASGFDLPFTWKEQDEVPFKAEGKRSYRQEGDGLIKEQVKRQGSLAFDANLRMKEKKKMQQLENGEDDEEVIKKIQKNLVSLNQIIDEEDKPKAKFEYLRKGGSRINESVLKRSKSNLNESEDLEARNDEDLRLKLWLKGKQHFNPNS